MRAGRLAFGLVAVAVFSGTPAAQERRYGLTPAQAEAEFQNFDWRRERSRIVMHGALINVVRACASNFGFTAVPEQSPTVMQRRIEAHLLLADNPMEPAARWAAWMPILFRPIPQAMIDRGADIVAAAVADPDRYAEAEARYMRLIRAHVQPKLEACRAARGDPFVGQHYLSGEGAMNASDERLRAMFAQSVREVAEVR